MHTTIPLTHSRYELSFKKHVTTACVQCRKKRRKCDDGTPCHACSSAEIECTYDYTDLRKRGKRQSAVDQSHLQLETASTAPSTTSDSKDSLFLGNYPLRHAATNESPGRDHTIQANQGQSPSAYLTSTSEGGSNLASCSEACHTMPATPQSLLEKEPEMSQSSVETPVSARNSKARRLTCKSHSHLNTNPEAVVRSRGQLQGKLDMKAWRSQARNHKILPRETSDFQIMHSAGRDAPKRAHLSNGRQSYRTLRPVRQARYAGPGYTRAFGNLPFSSSILANGYPAHIQARQRLNYRAPEHLIVPLTCLDESPLGRTFTDFQRLGKGLIANGTPASQVSEHGLIDVTLFFRPRSPDDPINASSWASEMLRSFRGTFSDALLLACAVCVGSLMRWVLMPTPDNYANLPPIMRPTSLQRSVPHPPWVDLMVFPTFRDSLVNELRDWAEPCVKAKWELSWPGTLEEALIHDSRTDRTFVSSAFASFVADPKNWLMQRSILETFPEIQGTEINIADE